MQQKRKAILFYYLSAFENTGGIEKFNRCFIKALNELPATEFSSSIVSAYDNAFDQRYNDRSFFKGFGKRRGRSAAYIVCHAFKHDVLVLGHINLAIVGVLVKFLNPRCKLVLIAHGIEIWDRLYFIKKLCLQTADIILAVSNYTKNQLVLRNSIRPERIRLFPNTIDPYFNIPQQFGKPLYLLERYGLTAAHKVIFTMSRLQSTEKYKGYDNVIAALPAILKEVPEVVYILGGKYDLKEKERINQLLQLHNVSNSVIITGYVADEEVTDHYQLADVFTMPSRKEGFGIVFLEALACGTPVIGGNQDGTVDALKNGSLGTLINPTKQTDLSSAVLSQLKIEKRRTPEVVQQRVLHEYHFDAYKNRLLSYFRTL